jgi:DNA-binding CsgD family transcriptional regulator
VRTVEGHLRQSFMKLNIAGRDEIQAALRSPAG